VFRETHEDARRQLSSEYRESFDGAREAMAREGITRSIEIQLTEDTEFALLEKHMMEDRIVAMTKTVAQKKDEVHELCAAVDAACLKAQGSSTVNRALTSAHVDPSLLTGEDIDDDSKYATSAWAHCSSMKFHATYMELREMHLRLVMLQRRVIELTLWEAKARAKTLSKVQKGAEVTESS
jgi:hypothetical protein